MGVESLGLPADREALMNRRFGDSWSISEDAKSVTIHAWVRGENLAEAVEVRLSGPKSRTYAVLWGLLQSLERG